jgi:hypothetical protein
MQNQNVMSNKFNLKWSTSFSYTGVQRFFPNATPCTTFLRNGGIYTKDKTARKIKTLIKDDDVQNDAKKSKNGESAAEPIPKHRHLKVVKQKNDAHSSQTTSRI